MLKRILFITFIIFLSIFISDLLAYNSEVVINFSDYQIITTTGFLIFLLTVFILSLYIVLYFIIAMFYPNIDRYRKKGKKLQESFNQYIGLMTEAFICKSAGEIDKAFIKLKKANGLFGETNLSKLLESQLYYLQCDYRKSEESFKRIQNMRLNLNLLNLKMDLEQVRKIGDYSRIKSCAEEILKIEPINKSSLESLFQIYVNNREWEKAYNILQIALKARVFEQNKMQGDILFVYAALGKMDYDNHEFIKAKRVLRQAYKLNPNHIQTTILLIKTYIALGKKSKALNLIRKIWKYNTNPKLAELYFSLLSDREKKSIKAAESLYRINPKSYESNLILARAYIDNEIYSKARRYLKVADTINETKYLYELMLKMEQADNGSSTIINNLKNKILALKNSCWKCSVCKREYTDWQPECDNCKTLNSLEWSE